ncbi:MAG: His/Gly/Thr/Pro-type tRNA ligase C-terminal domain-containing protein [Patescibacteria group bacterium]
MKKTKKLKWEKESQEGEIAGYYGFNREESPVIKKGDIQKAKILLEEELPRHRGQLAIFPEETAAMLRLYEEKHLENLPQPVMLYFQNWPDEKYFNLEILGCAKAISEATIIQTALVILREQGYHDLYVNINSLGDRESANHFFKELGNFCRKHSDALSADCRQAIRRDTSEFFHCRGEKFEALLEEAPKSVAFLSELAKIHFKEVLEYLEALDIPYRINNGLLGIRQLVSHTIFEIRDLKSEKDEVLAFGFRYNAVARKIGMKKEIPALGIRLAIKSFAKSRRGLGSTSKTKKPTVFFAQIGAEAKLKSLKIIEMLRQASFHLHQSLSKDKISSQVAIAENLKVPYIIIVGQKEALENTVIVRNMANRSQTIVPIPKLADHLKHLKQ